jgi:hypothetical protein
MQSLDQLPTLLGENEISIYNDLLTIKCVAEQSSRIRKAFPSLTEDFYTSFHQEIKRLNFTNNRLIEAVNELIANCEYPMPTLARVLGFDKKVKIYTYDDICDLVSKGNKWDDYKPIKTSMAKKMYAHVNDIAKYKLHTA